MTTYDIFCKNPSYGVRKRALKKGPTLKTEPYSRAWVMKDHMPKMFFFKRALNFQSTP